MGGGYTNSPIKWVRGKSKLAKQIIQLFPEHKGYVEIFGGAGWVLFAKEASKWEVLNDLDNNLYNFWDVIKNHREEFIKSFEFEVISRTVFNQYKEIYKRRSYKNNIEQAHILYYLLKAGVGASLPDGGGCGFGAARDRSRLRLESIPKDIEEAHSRLVNVTIECKDFREIIKFYDDCSTLFYIDPPYYDIKRASYPVGEFTESDYKDLLILCQNMKGKFLLTINDNQFIRELFRNFEKISTYVYYNVSSDDAGRRVFPELIIKNY